MAEKKTAAETAPKQKRCFMITPIGEIGSDIRKHADWVFKFAVQPVMADKGFVTKRADMMDDPFMINDSVFAAIDESDICVADLTNLNANVFYELGVRHALEKPVIHIAHVGTRIPFDTANYRTIFFDLSSFDAMEQLKVQIASQVETIMGPEFKLSNPLTQARGFQRMASSADPTENLVAALEDRVSALERDKRVPLPVPLSADRKKAGLFGGLHSQLSSDQNAWYEKLVEHERQRLEREAAMGLTYDQLVEMGIAPRPSNGSHL